jgi:hypothetical protein
MRWPVSCPCLRAKGVGPSAKRDVSPRLRVRSCACSRTRANQMIREEPVLGRGPAPRHGAGGLTIAGPGLVRRAGLTGSPGSSRVLRPMIVLIETRRLSRPSTPREPGIDLYLPSPVIRHQQQWSPWPPKRIPKGLQTDVRLKPDLRRKKLAFTSLSLYDGKLAFF